MYTHSTFFNAKDYVDTQFYNKLKQGSIYLKDRVEQLIKINIKIIKFSLLIKF
jgi:hypothetical protein